MRTLIHRSTALRPGLVCAMAFLASGARAQEVGEERALRKDLPSADVIADLPPDGGPEFNRLIHEQSPYLLQHARNPVDWYPWGPEAFEAAKREDKPVFLSVGYSTCHWCHVMEHESFEDEEVAALMNAAFICIKVDREERPDIDQVYMSVTQAMTGRGGWPMTVVMTPDKKPFFAGTYFPKVGRAGRAGMMDLVPALDKAWKEQRESVLASADQAVNTLAGMSLGTPGAALGVRTLDVAYRGLAGRFDARNGGFGNAPKFPVPHNLRFLLRYAKRTGETHALEMVEKTLHEMRKGGIWDHVGFGFHRYSTDRVWLLPHFEKMLYDQGLLAMACVEAWQVTGKAEYKEIADQIFAYVMRDMTSPEGGFFSAEDADSEGEEGLFYIWTPEELEAVLGEADGKLATQVFGVVPGGNFTDQGSGQKVGGSILHLSQELAVSAAELGLGEAELTSRLEEIRVRLFKVREQRIHPLKDDKVLTDWNGIMIAAFASAAKAFDSAEYRAVASRAADFMLGTLRRDDGRLLKRFRAGKAGLVGMLEDYAFAVWGLIETYEATFEERYLAAAIALTEDMIAHFHDGERGGFYMAPDDGEALIVRSKEIYDGAIPSGNSVAALNLLRLARLTGETRYEELAEGTMLAFSGDVARSPQNHTQLMLAVDFAAGPSNEVVISGVRGAEDTRAMARALNREFVPNKVVVLRPTGEADAISKLVPYVAEQVPLEGRATAYVCRDFACQAPTTDVEIMLAALAQAEGPEDPATADPNSDDE